MTFYLLVVTEDGEDSYSLWKTKQSAEIERRHIKEKCKMSDLSMDIIEIVAYD